MNNIYNIYMYVVLWSIVKIYELGLTCKSLYFFFIVLQYCSIHFTKDFLVFSFVYPERALNILKMLYFTVFRQWSDKKTSFSKFICIVLLPVKKRSVWFSYEVRIFIIHSRSLKVVYKQNGQNRMINVSLKIPIIHVRMRIFL